MFNYEDYYKNVSPLYNRIRLDKEEDFLNTLSVITNQFSIHCGKVLDIGCGTGKYGEALNRRGFTVTGIDKSQSQITEARKIINATLGNATNLPFSNESFDFCIMIMMIHHLEQRERICAFSEAHRVLVPGGYLVIKTCSERDIEQRLTSRFFPEALQIDLKRYPKIETLVNELSPFFMVSIKHSVVSLLLDKDETIQNFALRKSTNLGMLTCEQLNNGVRRMSYYYRDSIIIPKEQHNTFLICKKEDG